MSNLNSMLLRSTAVFAPATEGGSADMTAQNLREQHLEFASKAAEDTEFSEELSSHIEAKQKTAYDPVLILWGLQNIYGDKLEEFPEPGSEDGNLVDKYEDYVVNDKGKSVKKAGSWFTDFFDGTGPGKALSDKIAQLKEAQKKDGDIQRVTDPTIKERMQAGDLPWLSAEEDRLTAEKSAGRGVIVRAVKLHYAIARIHTVGDEKTSARVEYDVYTDKNNDEQLNRTQYPCHLWKVEKAKDGSVTRTNAGHYTVTDIIRFGSAENIGSVKEKGNTFGALYNSLKREGGDQRGGKSKLPPIKTASTFHDYLLGLRSFLDEDNKTEWTENVAIAKKLLSGKETRKENIKLLFEVIAGLREVASPFHEEYGAIVDAESKAGTNEPVKQAQGKAA